MADNARRTRGQVRGSKVLYSQKYYTGARVKSSSGWHLAPTVKSSLWPLHLRSSHACNPEICISASSSHFCIPWTFSAIAVPRVCAGESKSERWCRDRPDWLAGYRQLRRDPLRPPPSRHTFENIILKNTPLKHILFKNKKHFWQVTDSDAKRIWQIYLCYSFHGGANLIVPCMDRNRNREHCTNSQPQEPPNNPFVNCVYLLNALSLWS